MSSNITLGQVTTNTLAGFVANHPNIIKFGGYAGAAATIVGSIAYQMGKFRKNVTLRANVTNQTKFGHGTGTPYDMYQ